MNWFPPSNLDTSIFMVVGIIIGTIILYQLIKNVITLDMVMRIIKEKWHLLYILVLIPIHELAHTIIYPGFGLTDKTIVGFWPKKLVFYSYYDELLRINRLLLAMLSPFILLTVIPILLIILFELNYVSLAVINPIAGAGDILYSLLIIKQIPKNALPKMILRKYFGKDKIYSR